MIRYKLIHGVENPNDVIIKIEGDSMISFKNFSNEDPKAKNNTYYQEYLAWVTEGNTAEPADD